MIFPYFKAIHVHYYFSIHLHVKTIKHTHTNIHILHWCKTCIPLSLMFYMALFSISLLFLHYMTFLKRIVPISQHFHLLLIVGSHSCWQFWLWFNIEGILSPLTMFCHPFPWMNLPWFVVFHSHYHYRIFPF